MKRVVWSCDRCSRVLSEPAGELLVERGGATLRGRETIEICGSCLSALAKFLDAPALVHPPAGPIREPSSVEARAS